MPYLHVPELVEQMANAALDHLPNTELVQISAKAHYSAYEYTYRRGDEIAVFHLAYDFGSRADESEQGALLAAEVERHFPATMVVIPPVIEAVADDEPVAAVETDSTSDEAETVKGVEGETVGEFEDLPEFDADEEETSTPKSASSWAGGIPRKQGKGRGKK